MFNETHPVQFRGGIHDGTMGGLRPFGPHGLRINGVDPSDDTQWQPVIDAHIGRPESQVNISVDHPDPQMAQDIGLIAKHTIWNGRSLWPGREIPPEAFGQAANFLRQHESQQATPCPRCGNQKTNLKDGQCGCPQCGYTFKPGETEVREGVDPARYLQPGEEGGVRGQAVASTTKAAHSAGVSVDMTVISKWQVVALGELQQPGGVGATQDYNPVTDGPNPDGPNFADNAGNSPEQEQALQTWVNTTVEMLNRGETPETILAQLAHDGCPNPEEVLQRAQQQPEAAPVSDQIGQDPFEAPPVQDPSLNGQMEGLSQQPSVQAKVRIAGTTMTGTEIDRWEDMWGQGSVRVALDGGGTLDVSPDAIESAEGTTAPHPVSEIQSFIDSMPKVEPTRPHIEARVANLELVRRAVRSTISKVAFSDQVRLQTMDSAAAEETEVLKEILSNFAEDFEIAYVKAQPRFQFNAFDTATPVIKPWNGHAREAGAIWSVENFDSVIDDNLSYTSAAAHYATSIGLTGTQFQEFLAGADEHRKVRTEEFTATEPETTDNDGPAEQLFT